MSEEGGLAGNAKKVPQLLRTLPVILFVIGWIAGCNHSDNKNISQSENDSETPSVTEIYDNCGDILFAALYHLPVTQHLFENRGDLIGQPAHFFSDLLNQESKEYILIQLNQLYKQTENRDDLMALNRSLNHWCEAHQTIQALQRRYGYEEFLAGLLNSERFEYLFYHHLSSPVFQSDEFSAFDKVASLSSAQGQYLISTLITDLSMQKSQQFGRDISALKLLFTS